ncbi:uncharacterized protein LOC127708505 [Mytilus californianus]|uniref:uncharacterized protein LOC127708505 n=1 Tax=Mytilus californianus TaxID=6549 RepID=UPI0022462249|nr:uncharacterized protein LOC127708505 [Mytilus californianus]
MICLLRNLGCLLTPSNGWDQLPLPNDTVPGAYLATLKWYRNQLAHMTVTSMDTNEFTDKWTRVDKALTSLNNGQRPHEVTEILNYDLDGEQAKTLANAELKHMKKQFLECEQEKEQIECVLSICVKEKEQIESDLSHYREGNLPKNIADANATLVETWIKDDQSFYETKGTELVYATVKKCRCILVTSNSGSGKTATIRHIALQFKEKGFEIVPVECPDDLIKYRTNKRQVFLIDDVLGKYDLSPTLLDKWERINEKLISCLETERCIDIILCTLRSQIAVLKRFKNASTILNKEVINLEHESNVLSKEEKQKILIKHLERNNLEKEITSEEVEKMCETNYAFPLLCKLVSNDEERFRKRIAFFREPLSLLRNELDRISNENKKLYCILVICMLHNGSFSRRIFDIDSHEYDAKIYRIMQTCGLNMHKKDLEESALSAIGSYFTQDKNDFRFIHDALEETTGCHFYTFDPRVMFSECDILFIRDRVRLHSNENLNENADENIVIINEDELNEDRLKPLYDRVLTELNNGRFSSVLMSRLFKNSDFVRILGTHSKKNQSILGSKNTFSKTVSSERKKSTNHSIIDKISKILLNDELQDTKDAISRVIEAVPFRSTLMYWSVAFGCYEFFQYVWSEMTTVDRNSILGRDFIFLPSVKSFFPLAVLGGSLDIVSNLISADADVNCFSEFWETPLYIAVKSGSYDMVCLLLRNGAKVNLRGWFTMNIPIAVTSNKPELTSLILDNDLNQTELHKAVRHNELNNLKSNIRSENIDSKTKSGWTVLHYAVLLNNLEAVKVLFNEELPKSDDSDIDFTECDQREYLSRKPTPKLNIADNNGLTGVHLAVINNNVEILTVLLCHKAEIKVLDAFDRTPLHYTTSESVTKLLLTHPSRNQRLETNRNAEEGREYRKTPMSAFRTLCFNITQQNSFKNICRDLVNMPDMEGNTPLHSVLNRSLFIKESTYCIDTLMENGANPYLFNDRGTSAIELIKSSCDTSKIIDNSEKYRQVVKLMYKGFVKGMTFLFGATIGLAIYLSFVLKKESQNTVFCIGKEAESGKITLMQVTRSINVILLSVVFLWLLFITFNMRYSDLLRRFFLLFLGLILLGCVFFIFFGPFVYIQIIYRFLYSMMYAVLLCSICIKIMTFLPYFTTVASVRCTKRAYIVFQMLLFLPIVFIFSLIFVLVPSTKGTKFDIFHSMHNIKTLNISTSNCTEFSSANISCTSLAYNITYKSGTDFSVECHTDQNITTYNGTYGTLTVESAFIDWTEMSLVSLFCLDLSLHATFLYCLLYCIVIVYYRKIFRGNFGKMLPFLNGLAMFMIEIYCVFLYLFIMKS